MVSLTPVAHGRILIVDDDRSQLMVLEAHLRNLGYATTALHSVHEASAWLKSSSTLEYVCVVTDYWMPGGTGLDLLRILRAEDPTLAVIILTMCGDKDLIAGALRDGVHGFMEKPIVPRVLADHVTRAVASTRQQRELREATQIAQEVGRNQLKLLRHQIAKLGRRLQAHYQPFGAVSGDFLSIFPMDEQNFVMIASDTSGHDMKSAYQSSYFHGLARGMLQCGGTIEEVFRHTNRMLLESVNADEIDISLAAIAFQANLETMSIRCLNTGFPQPYLIDGEGMASPLSEEPSNPLGWFPDLPHASQQTQPVGHIAFWSDGLDDLADRLQLDPLSLVFRLCQPGEDKSKLTMHAADDIVVVRASFGIEQSVADQPFAILAQTYRGDQLPEINEHQTFIENSVLTALPGVPEDKLSEILVCLRESLINALKHGCKGAPDEWARVQASYHPSTGCLRLRVSDSGPGHDFDHKRHEEAAADELLTEHRGLVMINNLPAQTYFSGNGSIVTMDFFI
ncbi:Chemotaxis protein CheY [Lacunisphaera limnophila]|uniref:Chemotaxis protein CheY n=1 Tax=Lacunisphaera limnophila TaxID=1838286 RepID=A0A1D8AXL1_9BACT|nr:response regulator [Lacunisphaera limnophila]AOS45622.1 Chemotaxis protein CheY [Lacunisphaera limnophila]